MDNDICGAEEAKKILCKKGLWEQVEYDCKKAKCMIPLNMKQRNDIYSKYLEQICLEIQKKLNLRQNCFCHELKRKCYPEYIFESNKQLCEKCEDYNSIVCPLVKERDYIIKVQKALQKEWETDCANN